MITYEDKSFDTWEDVVKQYPAMWVVFDKADFDGARVNAGHIWVIIPDDEIISFRNTHFGEYKMCLRTTETSGFGGYIHGELIDA